jgi:hypothetical protein
LAICLALAAASAALLPLPASAQALLPPYEIATSVRSMGLEPITRPMRRGARYVLHAIDRRGAEVVVAADALNGRILFVRPVGYREAPIPGPVYADRYYPRVYPEERAAPRGSYERPENYQQQGNYQQQRNYQQQGNYDRLPPRNQEPSVIYANPQTAAPQTAAPQTAAPQPPLRAPSAAKPAAPKLAAKPSAKPPEPATAPSAAPVESAAAEQPATTGTASSPPPENPLAIPPVQTFE